MKVTKIFLQKSRTIKTEGTLGRDSYRKIMVGMECEVEEKETAKKARIALSKEVENAIRDEILALKNSQKKYTNF